jgi:hypothetical protein
MNYSEAIDRIGGMPEYNFLKEVYLIRSSTVEEKAGYWQRKFAVVY